MEPEALGIRGETDHPEGGVVEPLPPARSGR
jgi:hypothetical protein